MKITTAEIIELDIPFTDPQGRRLGWNQFDMVLIRLVTDSGLAGWGEAFAYGCRTAVAAACRDIVAPFFIGRTLNEPAVLSLLAQRELHIRGRYGILMFALSGFDIALWDLASRAAGMPLAQMLGAARPQHARPAYASLLRYGERGALLEACERTLDQGYRSIKLHEIDLDLILAAARSLQGRATISVDVNCGWTYEQASAALPALRDAGLLWLEEPVFPPEDFESLAQINQGFPVSAGENACTRHEFRQMLRMRAVAAVQPSVTKVGGVTEFVEVSRDAVRAGVEIMPHSPYFGPGYFATLHLAAALPGESMLEHLYATPAAHVSMGLPRVLGPLTTIPEGAGLGFSVESATLARFRK